MMGFFLLFVVSSKLIFPSLEALPLELEDADTFDLSYLGSEIYGKPSENAGKNVEEWTEEMEVNPEELGEYLEGDILIPSDGKNGLLGETTKWKDGIVPYEISWLFAPSDVEKIEKAMEQYHKYTCIRFRKKTSDDNDYISITNGNSGCWSSVGKTGGKQEINLQSGGCLSKPGTAQHELMHALGFTHEQNRFERDEFVEIAWDNIKSGREHNFKKVEEGLFDSYGVSYDYNSVMHYSAKAFSKNGKPTITPIKQKDVKIGQRDGFSKGDIAKINAMYNCGNVTAIETSGEETDKNNNNGILSFLFNG